jgi:hypothetical protein
LPIVLTGTVTPNAQFTVHNDPIARRREYLAAVRFYSNYAPVYFLENSEYPFEDDPEFLAFPSLQIRRFPRSLHYERGKGFQEFEMIDEWLRTESPRPARWLKVTGRYIFRNISSILRSCERSIHDPLVIDIVPRSRIARTHIFCIDSEFYMQRIFGRFRHCDDRKGRWIERVLYDELGHVSPLPSVTFGVEPALEARSGSTGAPIHVSDRAFGLKSLLRRANRVIDCRRLWYAK